MSQRWPQVTFREVLSGPLRNGVSPSTTGTVEERVLTLSAITGASFDIEAHKVGRFKTSPELQYRVDSSDLLICRGNGNPRLVGRAFFPHKDRSDLVFPDTVIAARVSRERVHPPYLQYVWNSRAVRFQIESRARTTNGTYKINQEILEGIHLALPPIGEQRRIAEVLDHADALRAKRRKAIALLDDLAQSVFLDMFGDPSADCVSVTVGELAAEGSATIRTGPFGSQLLHSEFVDSGIPVLGIDNVVGNDFRWSRRRFITEEKYQQLVRYRVLPGDVLITIMGTCGRCVIAPDDIPIAVNTKHLCCITLDKSKCLPEFLHGYFLTHPIAQSYLQKATKGAIMSGLNMGIIKALPVALPPIAEQRQYVGILQTLQTQKQQNSQQAAELDELFESLQGRAFRGEL